jgi:hypothetical protein
MWGIQVLRTERAGFKKRACTVAESIVLMGAVARNQALSAELSRIGAVKILLVCAQSIKASGGIRTMRFFYAADNS